MRAEYKRDVSHNYLILQGDEAADTSSYQVRMLTGNVIPSILHCTLQGLDGNIRFCYDITSRQSAAAFYEQKKISGKDLGMIFGGFVQVMEDMTEYLMNPEQLLLCPEYMYLDLEKRKVSFCCLPGYGKPVQEQFRELTEYFLPRLDHQDPAAVMLGYSVYRRALEPGFQLENIKEAVYTNGSVQPEKNLMSKEADVSETAAELPEISLPGDEPQQKDFRWKAEQNPEKKRSRRGKWLLCCGAGVLIILTILTAGYLGYLPWIPAAAVMAAAIILLGVGAAGMFLTEKKQKKKEEGAEWRKKVERELTAREQESKREETQKRMAADPVYGDIRAELKTEQRKEASDFPDDTESFGETMVLTDSRVKGPASLVSREAGELAPIYLEQELTVVGKLAQAADAVIPVATVSRVHARIRRKEGGYFLADLNSRNGTMVNGRMLKPDEEYELQDEDQVDFAQARYVFLK